MAPRPGRGTWLEKQHGVIAKSSPQQCWWVDLGEREPSLNARVLARAPGDSSPEMEMAGEAKNKNFVLDM